MVTNTSNSESPADVVVHAFVHVHVCIDIDVHVHVHGHTHIHIDINVQVLAAAGMHVHMGVQGATDVSGQLSTAPSNYSMSIKACVFLSAYFWCRQPQLSKAVYRGKLFKWWDIREETVSLLLVKSAHRAYGTHLQNSQSGILAVTLMQESLQFSQNMVCKVSY